MSASGMFNALFSDTLLPLIAQTATPEPAITVKMMVLILQIGLLIFAAQIGGKIATLLHLPSVLGELGAGIAVGPYALGHVGIPFVEGLGNGIFPLPAAGVSVAVTPELYAFSTIASIILLFMAGLETDLRMFIRHSFAGSMVGLGGALLSFVAGDCVGYFLLDYPFDSAISLFLGVLCMATSVGITARILSDKRKMDSPEGVTIVAGAVIDDVIGIIGLAIVMGVLGMEGSENSGGTTSAIMSIIGVGTVAVGTWLVFTVLGLTFAHKISYALKKYRQTATMLSATLGMTFLLSSIFEMAGLAMIIGAYIMGLTLSKTDLKYLLVEKLYDFQTFFVPIFFAVMGAMVDIRQFAEPSVLIAGLIYSGVAVAAKIIGCGVPAAMINFNWRGALRIGIGMVPRGEVALIIAGMGLGAGLLSPEIFGITIIMTLLTTVVAPPLLTLALDMPGRGTRNDDSVNDDMVATPFEFPDTRISSLVVRQLRESFQQEGFFATMLDADDRIIQMRKDNISISLEIFPQKIIFVSAPAQLFFIKSTVYETLLSIKQSFEALKEMNKPETLRHEMVEAVKDAALEKPKVNDVLSHLRNDCIRLNLRANDKQGILRELVDILGDAGAIQDRDALFKAVCEREKQMSTGISDGLAVPHTRSNDVGDVTLAMGIAPNGVDFDPLEGGKTYLFVLIVSPESLPGAHIQTLSAIAAIAMQKGFMEKIRHAQNITDVRNLFLNP